MNKTLARRYQNLKELSFPEQLKQKLKASEGLGTLEIVIIIAVLLAVALIFRDQLTNFATELMNRVFDTSILDEIA